MDSKFLDERFRVISMYQARKVSMFMERHYYIAYSRKLALELRMRGRHIRSALEVISGFSKREKMHIKWHLFYRQKYVLELVCKNARDVVLAMQRWDGIDNSSDYWEDY